MITARNFNGLWGKASGNSQLVEFGLQQIRAPIARDSRHH
jgi:hypothetical protein